MKGKYLYTEDGWLVSDFDGDQEKDWDDISQSEKLSEGFMEKYQDQINWDKISEYQDLSEDFMDKFQNKINWTKIVERQRLSEEFMEKHQTQIDWDKASEYQYMSQEFINKHQDQVNWDKIVYSQRLPKSFLEQHKDKINVELVEEDVAPINSKISQLMEVLKSMDPQELVDATKEIVGDKFGKMSKEEIQQYDQVSFFVALEAIKLNSFSAFNISFPDKGYGKGLLYGLILNGLIDDSSNPAVLTESGEQKLKDLYQSIKGELHCGECPNKNTCTILRDYEDL